MIVLCSRDKELAEIKLTEKELRTTDYMKRRELEQYDSKASHESVVHILVPFEKKTGFHTRIYVPSHQYFSESSFNW